jgi:hypothetical protein
LNPKIPAINPIASKNGFGIMAIKNTKIEPYVPNKSSKVLNHNFFLSLCSVKRLPEYPKKKEIISPKAAPKDAIRATRRGGYIDPPAITVKNAGPETKKVALEARLIKNIPINPREIASLK